jgi:hypothetical protein
VKIFLALWISIVLAACVSTPDKIVSTPAGGSLPIPITDPVAVKDLKSAASNLDQAVAIGALPANDPAPACLHDALQKAGIEIAPGATAPQSFAPTNDGVFSLGTILYIQVQQAKAMKGQGITVSQSCLALLGQIHLDALMATAQVGARMLPLPVPLSALPGLR